MTRWTRTSNPAPVKQKLWQAMRIMRASFTDGELATATEVHPETVKKYTRVLVQAGFVRVTRQHVRGQAGSANVMRLVRDTGPLAPIRRKGGQNGVYDQNTGIGYRKDGTPECDVQEGADE